MVLDLMIHDLDLVQSIVGGAIASIDAVGTPVFSTEIDIANARIRFVNGCVVNATASRVSLKTERKLRIFQDDAYLSLDLQQKILTVIRKQDGPLDAARLPVSIEEQSFEPGDAPLARGDRGLWPAAGRARGGGKRKERYARSADGGGDRAPSGRRDANDVLGGARVW